LTPGTAVNPAADAQAHCAGIYTIFSLLKRSLGSG
jgi:hypothetical protein